MLKHCKYGPYGKILKLLKGISDTFFKKILKLVCKYSPSIYWSYQFDFDYKTYSDPGYQVNKTNKYCSARFGMICHSTEYLECEFLGDPSDRVQYEILHCSKSDFNTACLTNLDNLFCDQHAI